VLTLTNCYKEPSTHLYICGDEAGLLQTKKKKIKVF